MPCGSITLAARTAATAFAFHVSATVAGTVGDFSVFADDGAAANSDAASATAATIRTLISDPPGLLKLLLGYTSGIRPLNAGCCIAEGRSRALLSGGEDGVQLRRSHTQQQNHCGRRQPEPYGNGLVVVAFILQAQRGRMSFGKPIDGGAAIPASGNL